MGSYLSTEQPNDEEEEVHNQFSPNPNNMACKQQQLQPNRLRKAPVTILSEILRVKAKLDEDLVKENNAILREFLDTFIVEMKKDKIFQALYQKVYFTGSYYSDLRVSTPDEFDLNLVMKLPFKLNIVNVEYQPQVPSFVKYSVTDQNAIKEKGLEKLFENGYLKPDRVRTWLQSVVDKARLTYRPPRGVVQVKCSSSGPAKTIKLIKRDGIIDIDLVPVIECSLGLKPPGIDGRVYAKVQNKLQCFLVPKPYQPSRQAPVNESERSRLWRAHYPEAESFLLYNLGCVKSVIKLLKLLRDREHWDILASYYLKTIVLWMVLLQPNPDYWKQDRIGERFVEALRKLADHVKERKIPYFFSSRYNLLEKLSAAHSENIYYRLSSILKQIERENDNLWGIFGCSPTFHM